jgi:hypothetical protein
LAMISHRLPHSPFIIRLNTCLLQCDNKLLYAMFGYLFIALEHLDSLIAS